MHSIDQLFEPEISLPAGNGWRFVHIFTNLDVRFNHRKNVTIPRSDGILDVGTSNERRLHFRLFATLFVIYLTGLFIRLRTIGDSAAHIDEAYTFWMVGNLELRGDWLSEAKLPSLPRWLAVPGYIIGGNGNDVALRSSPLLGWTIMYWSLALLLNNHKMRKGAIATSLILCFEPTIIGYSLYMKEDMVLAGALSVMLLVATTKRKYWTYLVVGLPFACKWTGGILPLILAIFWVIYPPGWIDKREGHKQRMMKIIGWGIKAICSMLIIFLILNPWYLTHQQSKLSHLHNSAAFDTQGAQSEECIGACSKLVLDSAGVWWFYLPFHTMQITPLFLLLCGIGLLSLIKSSDRIRQTASLGLISWLVCFVTYSFIISIDARHYAPVFFPGLLLLAAAGIEFLTSTIHMPKVSQNDAQLIGSLSLAALMISLIGWSASIAPEYREWTWIGDEDPYHGSTRTLWEENIVFEKMRDEVRTYVTTHPEGEGPRICSNFDQQLIWHEFPEGKRNYWMDSTARHWGNCEFIIYSKYWVGNNLQYEGVKLLNDIWHGDVDERFRAIRPGQCQDIECHVMAFKVLK